MKKILPVPHKRQGCKFRRNQKKIAKKIKNAIGDLELNEESCKI